MATPRKKNPQRTGAPTKFSKELMPKMRLLYRKGFKDTEVAEILEVTEQTINNWKKKHPDFFESLKDWKYEADVKVERSLYERACGAEVKNIKANWSKTDEAWVEFEETQRHPPDATSMIFWLKNRRPKQWRDKIAHEVSPGKDSEGNDVKFNFVVTHDKDG